MTLQYVDPGPQQDVATTGSGLGAGAGDHLPVGDYGGMDYRSAMRFALPPWGAWTNIVSAYLKFYISDHKHVAPKNSSIYCSRMNVPVWTKDQGTQDCENGFSGSNNTQYGDIASVSTNRISFSSGSTANAAKTLDVTAMVQYYKANNSPLVFVFDNNGSDQYTEIWSLGKSGTTYDATLTINYDVTVPPPANTAPTAPTLTGPNDASTVFATQPTLSWTHNDPEGDAQSQANVQLYNSGGTPIGSPVNVASSANSLVWPNVLTRGTTYRWAVATADAANGFGPYSAQRSFTVQALPVVTITNTRFMEWSNGAPRLRVKWTLTGGTQASHQVTTTAPIYDSTRLYNGSQEHLLTSKALSDNVGVPITVTVWTTDGLSASATLTITPRYGMTVHRRDQLAVPLHWLSAEADVTTPGDSSIKMQWGSNTSAAAAPTAWYDSLGEAPLGQWVFYRAWLLPSSAGASPSLNAVNIEMDRTSTTTVDKWKAWGGGALPAAWELSELEYVYGTRSITVKPTGGVTQARSEPITVKAGRSYILTGLMKSKGVSGANFLLVNASGTIVKNKAGADIRSAVLAGDTLWYDPKGRDVERYKTEVWDNSYDGTVYVLLEANGATLTQAWFDAIKLEESTVATPWSPSAIGATVVDAGGVQVDGSKGGIFRYRGSAGGGRDIVEGGPNGLLFGDVEVDSSAAGVLNVDGSVATTGDVLPTGNVNAGGFVQAAGSVVGAAVRAGNPATTSGVALASTGDIEICRVGSTPFIDFKNAIADDYDMRIILMGDNDLRVSGGNLTVEGNLIVTGTADITGVLDAPLPAPIRRVYTSGATTWTKPAGLRYIEVECQGGGGGGGGTAANGSGLNNAAGGGGGGGYARKLFAAAVLPASCTASVGGPGAAGGGGTAGGAGAASTFAGSGITTVSGTGGDPGAGAGAGSSANTTISGGQGGIPTGGDINVTGSDGVNGRCHAGIVSSFGMGGTSVFAGARRATGPGNVGQTGWNYGGGGTGACGTSSDVARAGGAGGQGIVIVTEYY